MSLLRYRTPVLRGIYAAAFLGAYLFFVTYMLSGDDSGSSDNSGVYSLLIRACIACCVGAWTGPTLHRWLFKASGSDSSSSRRSKKR